MEVDTEHFRHILLFLFQKGETAAKAFREICGVYEHKSFTQRTCERWFKKFATGDFGLEDDPRTGRPSDIDDDILLALVQNDRHMTTQEIGERFNIDRRTVGTHLKKLGMVKKVDVWVPHELTEKKTHGQNLGLRSQSKMERAGAFFEKGGYW